MHFSRIAILTFMLSLLALSSKHQGVDAVAAPFNMDSSLVSMFGYSKARDQAKRQQTEMLKVRATNDKLAAKQSELQARAEQAQLETVVEIAKRMSETDNAVIQLANGIKQLAGVITKQQTFANDLLARIATLESELKAAKTSTGGPHSSVNISKVQTGSKVQSPKTSAAKPLGQQTARVAAPSKPIAKRTQ